MSEIVQTVSKFLEQEIGEYRKTAAPLLEFSTKQHSDPLDIRTISLKLQLILRS